MANITLPAGMSLRELAARYGLEAADLDPTLSPDEVHEADQVLEVPDGFLRQVDRGRRSTYAAVPQTAPTEGMNALVAMNLTYFKNLLAGGLGKPTPEEEDSLAKAYAAYLRFEPSSNSLALDIWGSLKGSPNAAVRAVAEGGRSLAYAHSHLLFGEGAKAARSEGLSAARMALASGPRLGSALTGQALALSIAPKPGDIAEAQKVLEMAIHYEPEDPWAWYAMGDLLLRHATADSAKPFVARSLELDPLHPLSVELGARMGLVDLDGVQAACAKFPLNLRLQKVRGLLGGPALEPEEIPESFRGSLKAIHLEE